MNNMNENFDAFDDYAMQYDFEEDAIRRKYEHSYRVMELSDKIVYSLGLEEDDSYLACIIGLLHDVGRFPQWKEYKTFSDSKSINHAILGAKLLFDEGLIKKFKLDESDYYLVRTAIENHSVYKLDENKLKDKVLLHSKIVRDADKIDILYELSTPKIIGIKDDDSKISEEVKNSFYKHEEIDRKEIKTVNDRVLMKFGFVYGLYFDYSKKIILENEYLDRMYETLKNKKLFKPYFEEAKKYLEGCVKNVR